MTHFEQTRKEEEKNDGWSRFASKEGREERKR